MTAKTKHQPLTRVYIKLAVASDLALRDSANRFFDQLNARPEQQITVDFRGIRSITRSFAHQYLQRKRASAKDVREAHTPTVVKRMFEVVEAPVPKHAPLIPSIVRPLRLPALATA